MRANKYDTLIPWYLTTHDHVACKGTALDSRDKHAFWKSSCEMWVIIYDQCLGENINCVFSALSTSMSEYSSRTSGLSFVLTVTKTYTQCSLRAIVCWCLLAVYQGCPLTGILINLNSQEELKQGVPRKRHSWPLQQTFKYLLFTDNFVLCYEFNHVDCVWKPHWLTAHPKLW